MVHQLSLVSTIPHSSYVQTISTLQALTGLTSPQPVSTYTLICKPINKFKPKFVPGKVNQIEQYFMKCITTWDDLDSFDLATPYLSDRVSTSILFNSDSAANTKKIWTLQISDIPIAGKNQTCSAQNIFESTLVHTHTASRKDAGDEKDSGDLDKDSFLQFLEDLGYNSINQFWIKGVRFFHGDIVIEIFKVFVRDDANKDSPSDSIPLKLLDESNGFQIKAFINVPKSTDIDLITQGSAELAKLQDFLKNLIQLEIPDRIFMDSRVQN
ncbi:Mediator of RNA polymerase II transcription subunit 18 [Yamadazyma tenuis]|uniref:Mediator of RNA polymerase II transcription subunit 18 n=1 Tax=Candida tenuis (strain ATCC 10573 / BCRC 21748 / CBS 615 / JCM 9827 / NBRC 10315 / NRRL Y-1498 / VKM Y-70) TaxID=590646 RepID=G3BC15_CANTC|nr:uncharacterized protein CANTEDRAFT_116825 [Yamadazyma tenuis ATCC 10573]XP_006690471.1 uncharacterized protein CANTEDRAFT_116825 [Yamadazyma tenuis ATCC 10573]EGV61256.1 hypothetical protein CANTEDRAFT_116825 [Yamadazyma tenuis ATCC 10573]EGV61257.1 hypothetical protein CANTEDRAFT_116825 [Yamadazyma tenuis ATCC 10573]WEJ93969.1 Mediator of RNA polymerase II transcription subunit 18 [Yamadazyma tenuis]